jgi:antirestriction protein
MQRALAKADARDKHQRELEAAWDHQQTNHENLSKEHRVLKSELESKQKSLDAANRVKENMEQRNIKLLAELSELRAQLSEQKRVNLLSDDEKIVELTQLRQQLQEERAAKENALKAQKSTESSMEYMKDNLRQAQDSASNWKMQHDIGQEEITRLQKIASGELTTTKKVHYNSGYEALMQQYKQERVQKEHYRRLAEKRDEEMVKLKEKEKKAYGTRQSSVPRSPRVGPAGASSRAGSPLPARDRVSNLRNG